MSEELTESQRNRRLAWIIWILLGIVMSGLAFPRDHRVAAPAVSADGKTEQPKPPKEQRTVTGAYRSGSVNWFAGQPLYNMQGSGFIYSPQTAIVFAPWGLLPIAFGEVAWRWTILIALAAGVFRFTRLINSDGRWFLINTVVSGATAAGCLLNGQATVIITGMMLLACCDLSERRWTRATLLLVMALAFKPTALILILLVGALFLPMLWRLAIGLTILGVMPFLAQESSYVISQFDAFFKNSEIAFHVGETGYWAQFFGIWKVAGIEVPPLVQKGTSAIVGLGTLVACWLAVRKLPAPRGVFYLYAISTCYLMLFNSRTEGSTYAMVAPVYGLLLASAWLDERHRAATYGLLVAIVATVFNYDLVHLFTRQKHVEVWLCPFICLNVTVYILLQLSRELKTNSLIPRELASR